MTNIRPIHNEDEYEAALAAFRPLIENEPEPGTPEADVYDLLALVIQKYEDEHYPIDVADPVEVVRLVMEQGDHTREELAEILGGAPRVSEFFNRRRELTLSQIKRLRQAWRIPADLLIAA
ncbi:MAG TPA: transcriptional regulator [Caulobacteraceae bacterium]